MKLTARTNRDEVCGDPPFPNALLWADRIIASLKPLVLATYAASFVLVAARVGAAVGAEVGAGQAAATAVAVAAAGVNTGVGVRAVVVLAVGAAAATVGTDVAIAAGEVLVRTVKASAPVGAAAVVGVMVGYPAGLGINLILHLTGVDIVARRNIGSGMRVAALTGAILLTVPPLDLLPKLIPTVALIGGAAAAALSLIR